MIQASDLRIGSYASICGLNQKMRQCHFNEYINEKGYFVYINPIPLTEEILLKCGFDKIGVHYCINAGNNDIKIKIGYEIYGYLNLKYFNNIYYLHQLQNLYLCLVGKELEINL